ncbi:hypothetical protein DRN98_07665 [Methanosarcinales archaeon]|nr:MAG: hypothetical protein DRN98_07665 [Methanosarcinales archaeon]
MFTILKQVNLKRKSSFILIWSVLLLVFAGTILGGIAILTQETFKGFWLRLDSTKTYYLASAGVDYAVYYYYRFRKLPPRRWINLGEGEFLIDARFSRNNLLISSIGRLKRGRNYIQTKILAEYDVFQRHLLRYVVL